jgi:hypothetical protein
MTNYEALAVDLARTLTFTPKPPIEKPDPLAMTLRAFDRVPHDFAFALSEAFNAGSLEELAAIQAQLSACIEQLQVVEQMGSDFEKRMR